MVVVRKFTNDGTPLMDEFVATSLSGLHEDPTVTNWSDGGFFLGWTDIIQVLLLLVPRILNSHKPNFKWDCLWSVLRWIWQQTWQPICSIKNQSTIHSRRPVGTLQFGKWLTFIIRNADSRSWKENQGEFWIVDRLQIELETVLVSWIEWDNSGVEPQGYDSFLRCLGSPILQR